MKNIGEVISFFRKNKNMTQEELAQKVNLSRVTVVKIENSQRALSLEEASNIAKVFSMGLDSLYSYINQEQEEKNEKDFFVKAFKAKGIKEENIKDVKRIEMLVDALFTQSEIRGE